MLFGSKNLLMAQEDKSTTVAITASGSGKTSDEAKQAGLRSAIEQAFGAFISSKTEILNDKLISDEITSVASGNIQSYDVLNESQFPDGSWGVTLKAVVSVNKLTSFVEAKGIAIEIKGSMFAVNIKQQLLNEQGEIEAVCEMVGLLHEPMQTSFDYIIKSSDPKSLDAESKNWAIPLVVTATANKNIDFCANYCIKTLAALSLTAEEVTNYKSLNKQVHPVIISYKGEVKTYDLRKQTSIDVLNTFINNWEFYTRSFIVQSGIDESIGNGKGNFYKFNGTKNNNFYKDQVSINFLTVGDQAATFSWEDKRTLQYIEQMTGYTIKPSGIRSHFKYGGFVVTEENGHGLICALIDLGECFWTDNPKKKCEDLDLNGFKDWYLPSKDDLIAVYTNLKKLGIGNFLNTDYWFLYEGSYEYKKMILNFNEQGYYNTFGTYVRAVRKF